MRTVTLAAARAKPVWLGHPWVFADSVARVEGEGGDDWVRVVDGDGKVLGRGFLSPESAIRVRLLTRSDAPDVPDAVIEERLARAVALRARLFPDPQRTNAYRVVHAEGDGLPGLVVDRLADVLVAQFAIGATHARRDVIAAHLLALTGASTLLGRHAGYEEVEGIHDDLLRVGDAPADTVRIREEGLVLEASPLHGQKTGHYVDQRENRRLVGELAQGLEVLDLYAGTGGFALQCLRHGARCAHVVEASERSVAAALRNAQHNGVRERFEAERGDVTHVLAALRAAKRQFGLVVADPPNFFPRRGPSGGALKAHRELNVRALSRVGPGGFLATFSCSARLDAARFLDLLRSASRECRRGFRVLRELGAGPDHPVAHGLPEGRYLTGFLLQVDAEESIRPAS